MTAMRDAKGNLKFPYKKPEGQCKVNSKTVERSKVNSEEGQHKVCPSTVDDTKYSHTNQIDAQSNIESISTPMDLKNPLLKSQHLPTMANMTETRDIHYQEDIV